MRLSDWFRRQRSSNTRSDLREALIAAVADKDNDALTDLRSEPPLGLRAAVRDPGVRAEGVRARSRARWRPPPGPRRRSFLSAHLRLGRDRRRRPPFARRGYRRDPTGARRLAGREGRTRRGRARDGPCLEPRAPSPIGALFRRRDRLSARRVRHRPRAGSLDPRMGARPRSHLASPLPHPGPARPLRGGGGRPLELRKRRPSQALTAPFSSRTRVERKKRGRFCETSRRLG